jgi:hypothetical protein
VAAPIKHHPTGLKHHHRAGRNQNNKLAPAITSQSVSLKDRSQFLKSDAKAASNGWTDQFGSFRHLVGLASNSVASDLLRVLKPVKGFGPDRDRKSDANADLASDIKKHSAGLADTDHSAKTALKNILKPND